jgi:hypothetical protein
MKERAMFRALRNELFDTTDPKILEDLMQLLKANEEYK